MTDPNTPGSTPSPDPYTPAPGAPAQGYPQAPAYPQTPGYAQAPGYGQAPYGAAPGYSYPAPPKTNTLAIVSLVSALVGVFVIPFIGNIAAVITGHMALNQLKTNGEQGRGLALAGTIIGWVGLGLAIIGTIAVIAWFGFIFANAPEWSTS